MNTSKCSVDLEVSLNQRVSCAERRGTVRFVGSFEDPGDPPGMWAGVEWDEAKPGLHDGVHKGKRFFRARPSSGSFVLSEKLGCGISISAAIQQKYGRTDMSNADIGVSFGQKEVVAVGWDKVLKKVSDLDRLAHADVTGMDVNGTKVDLHSVIPNILSLAIGKSLIGSWSVVLGMIRSLTRLTILDLSENRLLIDCSESFTGLKRLILRRNLLVWDDVLKIIAMFPSLEEISLVENNISTISSCPVLDDSKLSIVDLDMQLVPFSSWSEVCNLGKMTSLTALQLSGNRFSDIHSPEDNRLFLLLTNLSVKLNRIADWRSINELNKLPRLENLRIYPNPVLESVAPETARQLVIAKIVGLKVLNQSPITPKERNDSELDYMRRYGAEWLSISNSEPVDSERMHLFLTEHPRYPAILASFGSLEIGEVQSSTAKHLKDSLIKIVLQFGERKQEKSIPLTMNVLKLKRIAERLFRIDEIHHLSYSTPDKPGTQYLLDDDQKDIAHYDIKSGDTILFR